MNTIKLKSYEWCKEFIQLNNEHLLFNTFDKSDILDFKCNLGKKIDIDKEGFTLFPRYDKWLNLHYQARVKVPEIIIEEIIHSINLF